MYIIYANESNATNDMKLSAKVRGSGRDCFWQQNQQNPKRWKNWFHRSQSLGSLNPNPPKSLRWAEKVRWLSGTTTPRHHAGCQRNEWLKHFKTNAKSASWKESSTERFVGRVIDLECFKSITWLNRTCACNSVYTYMFANANFCGDKYTIHTLTWLKTVVWRQICMYLSSRKYMLIYV